MAYGQILQSQAPGAGIVHTVGTATFCAFLIQDRTAGGVALPAEDAWIDTKAAGTFTLNDTTAGGPGVYDVFLTSAYTGIDVGPIVAGNTRNNTTQLYTPWLWNAAGAPAALRRPAYRSLHTGVTFTNGIGTTGSNVQITHNLGTVSVLVFASPTFDPKDTGGAKLCRVFLASIDNINQITLTSVCDQAGNFAANSPVTYDVMILSAPTVGHSLWFPKHLATAGPNAGLPSYDYSGADVARVTIPSGLNSISSYTAGYGNVDGITLIGGGGKIVTHNLRGNASTALVLPTATPGLMVPYVSNRAPGANPTTTITLAEIGAAGPLDNAHVLVLRPYSINRL